MNDPFTVLLWVVVVFIVIAVTIWALRTLGILK